MKKESIVLASLKESFRAIGRKKSLFITIIFLQILFFLSLFYVSLHYQSKMLDNTKAIFDYMNELQFNELNITNEILQQKNILGDDPLLISRNFNELEKNFRFYIIYSAALAVIFTVVNYGTAHSLLSNDRKNYRTFRKIFVIAFFYIGITAIFFYSLFSISLSEFVSLGARFGTKFLPFLIFSAIFLYFMFISLALARKAGLNEIVQKTLSVGIKKIPYMAAVFAIDAVLILATALFLVYAIDLSPVLMSFAVLLVPIAFVFGRIFLIIAVEKLEETIQK